MQNKSLRILSLDGGGMKGYTSLLILRRILRTMATEGSLSLEPKPCDIFDLIIGTSTGGLIAIMLGRLELTIDECIEEYETTGKAVFSRKLSSTKFGKVLKGASGSAFYDIGSLQNRVRDLLQDKKLDRETAFLETDPKCKV
jgi:patatin-like phospholipase/acyl hydrolase